MKGIGGKLPTFPKNKDNNEWETERMRREWEGELVGGASRPLTTYMFEKFPFSYGTICRQQIYSHKISEALIYDILLPFVLAPHLIHPTFSLLPDWMENLGQKFQQPINVS